MRRRLNLNCELAGPAGLRGRAGGLAHNETLYRHGMLGKLDLVDPKPYLADDLQAYGIEQPPDVGHYNVPRRAGMRGQPSAAAPDADDCVISGPGYRIAQHAPRLVEELLRPRDRGDHRRRRARDKLWPQHARLGVVFILNLLSGGARHYVENVIPGDHRLHAPPGSKHHATCTRARLMLPLSQGEPTRDSPIFPLIPKAEIRIGA